MSIERHIYCLEGNWSKNPNSKQSIKPILDVLYYSCGVKYVYRKCNTKAEFLEGLRKFTFKRYSNYTILYIAFHGRKNKILVGNESVTLKEISSVLNGRLEGVIVHFGSCSTLGTTQNNISSFIDSTKCALISGYAKDVDYIASSAFDLIYFELLQRHTKVYKIKDKIFHKYQAFIENLMFVVIA